MEKKWVEKGGILILEEIKEPTAEPWVFNINIGDWGPRKANPEEIAEHEAERQSILRVIELLNKINNLIVNDDMAFYQLDQWDGSEGYENCPPIKIGNISTWVDNETGLLVLPDAPEKWDENTIVEKRMPMQICGINLLCTILP